MADISRTRHMTCRGAKILTCICWKHCWRCTARRPTRPISTGRVPSSICSEADWSPAPGTAGQIVEPGHHFEWVWLLRRYAEATGEDISKEADTLYRFATAHGRDQEPGPAQGLVFDSVLRSGTDAQLGHGTSLDDNKRLWVQTEAIKAQLARLEAGPDAVASEHLEVLLERLFGLYLAVGHGNWQDHLDAGGGAIAETAPASSFYHLFLCLTEVLRVRDQRTDLC
jgi:mannose/cellobiose epimerase-like protein (N-acyl-D-glucosamine 2-epimerase family)